MLANKNCHNKYLFYNSKLDFPYWLHFPHSSKAVIIFYMSLYPIGFLFYPFSIFFLNGVINASIDLSTPTNIRATPTPNRIPPTTSSG